MDELLPGNDDPRRRVIRDWLATHPNPTNVQLAESGYVAPHWPEPWGLGADPIHQLIIDDELCVYGAYDYAQVSPLFTDAHHRGLA